MAYDAPEYYVTNRTQWRHWLVKNHEKESSVWLVFDKGKNRQLTYDDIVEEALCFGWVDSLQGSVGEAKSKLYMSRRKPNSVWSKPNKLRIAAMSKSGQMYPAGIQAVKIAKVNGSWDLLTKSDNLIYPPELIAALKQNKAAQHNFENFSDSSKRIILGWIYMAKRDETKLKRVQETVELAAKNIKAR